MVIVVMAVMVERTQVVEAAVEAIFLAVAATAVRAS